MDGPIDTERPLAFGGVVSATGGTTAIVGFVTSAAGSGTMIFTSASGRNRVRSSASRRIAHERKKASPAQPFRVKMSPAGDDRRRAWTLNRLRRT